MHKPYTREEKENIVNTFLKLRKQKKFYTVSQYLQNIGVSITADKFSKYFKEIYGISFSEYQLKYKKNCVALYEEEKRKNPDLSIAEFARKINFEGSKKTLENWIHEYKNKNLHKSNGNIKIVNTQGSGSSKAIKLREAKKTSQRQKKQSASASPLMRISEEFSKKIKADARGVYKKKYYIFEIKNVEQIQKFVAMVYEKVKNDKYTQKTREYLEQNLLVLLTWFNEPLIIEKISEKSNEYNFVDK